MFTSLKQKFLLGIFIITLISIPIGAYLASERQNPNVSAKKETKTSLKPLTSTPSATQNTLELPAEEELPDDTKTTIPTTFGPTLNLKLVLEGRPTNKMASKVFVGIAEGLVAKTAKYLLSFYIDLPDSGEFEGLSLAGLTTGTVYSAIIKGPAQIATSSAFTMSPTTSKLNSDKPITLLTGDLNEDNTINSADYSIARTAFGTTLKFPDWNPNIDFNLDGIINTADLAIILKNMAKTGDSGLWISQIATTSAIPNQPSIGSAPGGGYWFWMPSF